MQVKPLCISTNVGIATLQYKDIICNVCSCLWKTIVVVCRVRRQQSRQISRWPVCWPTDWWV